MPEHTHTHSTESKNLIWSIVINGVIVVFEVVFGLLAGSFALIAEALHNLTDIGSMVLSLWGEQLSDRPPTDQKTYGYKRAEVLIAFVNGGALLAIVGFVLVEAIIKLFHPGPVSGLTMMIVATVALIGNGLATYLLQKGANKNLNLRSAWLHSLQDAVFSFGVIISAVIIYFTGWTWLDPLASIIISIFLLRAIIAIILEAVDMLLDSVPRGLDFSEIKAGLLAMSEVVDVYDLHIWQTGSENRLLSAHIITKELDARERVELIARIQKYVEEKYHIGHATLQVISEKEAEMFDLACEHCN